MNRIEREKNMVGKMIAIFCRHKHKLRVSLCPDCQDLCQYAWERLDKCPFGVNKTKCADCRVHCYAPARREAIIQVMRFSGPRVLLHNPVTVLKYIIKTLKTNKKNVSL